MCRVNWSEYNKTFDIFRDTDAQILEKRDYDDYEGTYNTVSVCEVTGDLQDYSGALAEKDFGLAIECQKKFYCPENDNIHSGQYFAVGTQKYRIEYVKRGKLGLTLLLKEADFDDRCEQGNEENTDEY